MPASFPFNAGDRGIDARSTIAPTRGRIVIAGHDMAKEPVAAKSKLAYVPDDPRLFDQLTVWEHFIFVAKAYRLSDWVAKANELLATFELNEKRDSLCSELSRGMRQKVAICCGYLHQPRAIMLDEPLTGLDAAIARQVRDLLNARVQAGAAIILTTHILEVAERLADRIGIVARGRLVAEGTLAELKATTGRGSSSLEDVFLAVTGKDAQAA